MSDKPADFMKKLRETKISTQAKKRMIGVLLVMMLGIIIVVVFGLVRWQFLEGDALTKKAYEAQSRDRDITPRRGTIYDSTGKPLAISANISKVIVNPSAIKAQKKLPNEEIAKDMAEILKMDEKDIMSKITRSSFYVLVKRQVEDEMADKLSQWIKDKELAGIYLSEDTKRYYPNNNLASHILGFTGYDNQGLNGIELTMDEYLRGSKGRVSVSLDGKNRELPLSEEKRVEARDGYNLTLTIDETIQYFAEKELEKAMKENKVKNGGVVIISDPKTGDILAMSSKPDFNLNDPYGVPNVAGVNPSKWKGNNSQKDVMFLNKTVWRNKAIVDTYEPGSTFKAITSAAGLEEGVVTPETRVNDAPVLMAGKKINCWRVGNLHGAESFAESVYNSCNPVFTKVALSLGITKFYSYLKAFGLASKTGVDLPAEGINLIHTNPTQLDMAVAAFGQRFTVTPLQMIMAYGAIANGGNLMKPRLVKEITDENNNIVKKNDPEVVRRVISTRTSDQLKAILQGVVDKGTGRNAYVPGYNVAGKTGTSETIPKEKNRYIASFSCFAPADNPQICVIVILDKPTGPNGHGGGACAAPVAKKIVEDTLTYLEVERKYTSKDTDLVGKLVRVPDVKGKTVSEAKAILQGKNYKLKCEISGEDDGNSNIVIDQMPKKGMRVTQGSQIILYVNNENIH